MTTVAASLDGFSTVLARAFRWARRALWVAAAAIALVVILEAVHLFELLARIHPWVAWGALLLVGVPLLSWTVWRFAVYLRTPRVLSPPPLPPAVAGWNEAERERYRDFAVRYLKRQAANPRMPADARAAIPAAVDAVRAAAPADDDPRRAASALTTEVETVLNDVLAPLDAEANRQIRRAAVEVAVATAVSPSILMDSLITLTRNVDLMSRLAGLYYGRPGLVGTLRVVRDVLGTAVAAGALEVVADHVTGTLSEIAGSWSTRLLGPLGQGMVNGVVTMRFGAATKRRCRSLGTNRLSWLPWRLRDYRRAAGKLYDWVSEDVGPAVVQPISRWVSRSDRTVGDDALDGPEVRKDRIWHRLLRRRRRPDPGTRDDDDGAEIPPPEGDPLLDSDLMD
jgi:hypothetical protein